MAVHQHTTAAVVQLPTAAPNKVRQRWSQTRKAERDALLRFPHIYKSPLEREREAQRAERLAKAMEADVPAVLLMVRAIGQVLTKQDQLRAATGLALTADAHGGEAACAFWEQFVTLPGMSWKGEN